MTIFRLNEHELMTEAQNCRSMVGRLTAAKALFLLAQEYKRRMNEAEHKYQGCYLAVNKANTEIAQLRSEVKGKVWPEDLKPKRKRRKPGVRTRAVIRKMKAERAAL